MWIVRNFTFEGVEYMVCDMQAGYVPGTAGMELLADRHLGVGADRVLLAGAGQKLRVFSAQGSEQEPDASDHLILAYAQQADSSRLDARFQALKREISYFEAHVTQAFCRRMEEADKAAEAFAC